MIPGQLDIYEVLNMITKQAAINVADAVVDDLIERMESQLGIELGEEKLDDMAVQLEAEIAECLQEAFDEL